MSDLLADADAFEVRFGPIQDRRKVEALLGDATAKVRHEAGLHLSRVVDDVITVDGDGSRVLFLPELPVTAVAAVEVEGVALDVSADVDWWEHGEIRRRDHQRWPDRPRSVEVTYSHGWQPVEDWIVGLVCSMVWESMRPETLAGEMQITTGSQTVSYAAARANLWVPPADAARLAGLRGPAVA